MEEDDDATQVDMPVLESSYDVSGPTLQDQESPFRAGASGTTTPGMPAVRFDADIRTVSDGPPTTEEPVLTPPALDAPELAAIQQGATLPETPALGWDQDTEPAGVQEPSSITFDDASTEPLGEAPRQPPTVPKPGDPLVQISPSMELQVAKLDDPEGELDPRLQEAASTAEPRPNFTVDAPTEVLRPAMKRPAKERAGSDAPLMLLLVLVGLVILALAGAVVWGVMRSL